MRTSQITRDQTKALNDLQESHQGVSTSMSSFFCLHSLPSPSSNIAALVSQIATCDSPLLEHSLGPAPVTPGELVYMQIHSRLSIEGITAQATDASHSDDPSFSEPEWQMKRWPAVVLNVKVHKYWSVMVLPLRQGAVVNETGAEQDLAIRVSPQSCGGDEQWPWEETVMYACPLMETFTCLPDQVSSSSRTPHSHTYLEPTFLAHHQPDTVVPLRRRMCSALAVFFTHVQIQTSIAC